VYVSVSQSFRNHLMMICHLRNLLSMLKTMVLLIYFCGDKVKPIKEVYFVISLGSERKMV